MTLITGQGNGEAGNGSEGTGSQPITDWRSSLPETLRSEKVFESIKGKDLNEAFPELAKQFVHAQRLVGADKIVLPTDKSTPEEIAAFRKKLGVPDKFEDYGYKLPEGLRDDQLDKARIDLWRKEMHEAGIPKAAAERLMNKFLAEEHQHNTAQAEAREKLLDGYELQAKQEFGDKLDEALNYSRWAVKEFGGQDIITMLDETGLGSHPAVIRMMSKIGSVLAEDKGHGGGGGQGFGGMSPADAQAALSTFNRDERKQKALFDANDPAHADVVKERQMLFAAAFPAEKK